MLNSIKDDLKTSKLLSKIGEDIMDREVSTNFAGGGNSNSSGNRRGDRGDRGERGDIGRDGGGNNENKETPQQPNGNNSQRKKGDPDPYDSSSDDGGKGRRRAGKDALSKLFVDRRSYKDPDNARRGTPKCDVVSYARGTDLTIENWILQMEAYFKAARIPIDCWVGLMVTKIEARFFNEVSELVEPNGDYFKFRRRLIRVFEEPDAIQAYMQELNRARQDRDEPISDYMSRVRLLVIRAHRFATHAQREEYLISAFTNGLYDGQLALHIATVNPSTSSEAERIALAGESMRKEFRSRKSTGAYPLKEEEVRYSGEDEDEPEEEDEQEIDEEDEAAMANAESRPLKSQWTTVGTGRRGRGKWTGSRPRTAKSNCYQCGQPGHFKSDCPQLKRRGAASSATCGLCAGPHGTDSCPQLSTAAKHVQQSGPAKTDVSKKANDKAGASEVAAVLGEDPLDAQFVTASPELRVVDPAMPSVPETSSRLRLFFVEAMVQSVPMWILADSGSSRNLINENVYRRLPYQSAIRDPGDVRVIGGSGEALRLLGFAVLPVVFGATLLWHEFGVVADLPLEALVGGDIFIPHQCTLSYLPNGKKRLEFGVKTCAECERFRQDPSSGAAVQLRYVDREHRKRRNRVKLGANFVAVLPDTIPESENLSDTRSIFAAPKEPVQTSAEPVQTSAEPVQTSVEPTGKLQKVMSELHISELKVSEEMKKAIVDIVKRRLDAFAATPTDLGRTKIIEHRIKTGEAQPFKHKLRAVPFSRCKFLEQELERLQAVGAISPAPAGECPYASRTVLVSKKDGTTRMCVDYRDLNAQTEKDCFPLPRIDDVWPTLSKAKFFASLDLLMGYHQVEVSGPDRIKTAFVTHKGLFIYNVMPFGLCNAPATFQRLMERIFSDRIGIDVLVYLDDVLMFGPDHKSLLSSLDQVLERLINAGLKCKPSKCSISTDTIHYLGHVVSASGIQADPSKLDKIKQWSRPRTGVEMASFLGFCNYYRDLVPDFAHVSDGLYKVTRQEQLQWTSELEDAFQRLKSQMLELPLIKLPDPDRNFVLETDASKVAVGAVLKQYFDSINREYPVAFFSRALTSTERNYSAYELEMYAVVRAVERFRVYLLGRPFLLRTDHMALVNLLKRNLPPTSRVEKWILRLSEYNFQIEHQKGIANVMADILSRLPFASGVEKAETSQNAEVQTSAVQTPKVKTAGPDPTSMTTREQSAGTLYIDHLNIGMDTSCYEDDSMDSNEESEIEEEEENNLISDDEDQSGPLATLCVVNLPIARDGLSAEDLMVPTWSEFAEAVRADEELQEVKKWLEAGEVPTADLLAAQSARVKEFAQLFDQLKLRDGLLFLRRSDDPERELIVVPARLVDRVIRYNHEGFGAAHQAAKATTVRTLRVFYWPGLKRDIRIYVTLCDICYKYRKAGRLLRAGLRPMDVGGRGDCLAMDVMGGQGSLPLTARSNRYILNDDRLLYSLCACSAACRSISRINRVGSAR